MWGVLCRLVWVPPSALSPCSLRVFSRVVLVPPFPPGVLSRCLGLGRSSWCSRRWAGAASLGLGRSPWCWGGLPGAGAGVGLLLFGGAGLLLLRWGSSVPVSRRLLALRFWASLSVFFLVLLFGLSLGYPAFCLLLFSSLCGILVLVRGWGGVVGSGGPPPGGSALFLLWFWCPVGPPGPGRWSPSELPRGGSWACLVGRCRCRRWGFSPLPGLRGRGGCGGPGRVGLWGWGWFAGVPRLLAFRLFLGAGVRCWAPGGFPSCGGVCPAGSSPLSLPPGPVAGWGLWGVLLWVLFLLLWPSLSRSGPLALARARPCPRAVGPWSSFPSSALAGLPVRAPSVPVPFSLACLSPWSCGPAPSWPLLRRAALWALARLWPGCPWRVCGPPALGASLARLRGPVRAVSRPFSLSLGLVPWGGSGGCCCGLFFGCLGCPCFRFRFRLFRGCCLRRLFLPCCGCSLPRWVGLRAFLPRCRALCRRRFCAGRRPRRLFRLARAARAG